MCVCGAEVDVQRAGSIGDGSTKRPICHKEIPLRRNDGFFYCHSTVVTVEFDGILRRCLCVFAVEICTVALKRMDGIYTVTMSCTDENG